MSASFGPGFTLMISTPWISEFYNLLSGIYGGFCKNGHRMLLFFYGETVNLVETPMAFKFPEGYLVKIWSIFFLRKSVNHTFIVYWKSVFNG